MPSMKKKYPCKITFYGRKINRVIINPHAQKHQEHGGNLVLDESASVLDKTKYELCQIILACQQDNKFTIAKIAERIQLKEAGLTYVEAKLLVENGLSYNDDDFATYLKKDEWINAGLGFHSGYYCAYLRDIKQVDPE
ncbi:3864_t:CDS:2 [Funneliformis geosporum]|uniref:3864_t:CDS:1 n=1 Tax=Funneliformis geosporum TaxID=1117311 RepID=A0A9W4WVM9_9GLOM|nr:3864_t:CDS:2 [Funneliformis geosporum]